MTQWLLVGTGGFVGALARYALSGIVQRAAATSFPVGTLAVNVIGCATLGYCMGWFEARSGIPPEIRSLLVIGVLGSFTTFSAFSYDTIELIRTQHWVLGALNLLLQLVLGLSAAFGSLVLARG